MTSDLGDLLLAPAFYPEAILYDEESVMIYGKVADTLYRIAVCHCLLGEFSTASPIVKELRAYDPNNEAFLELIQEFGKELTGK